MTTYAIGRVNGDYRGLLELLEKIQFDPESDCLWFAGNVVNTGPDSLAVLRFIKDLGKKAVLVLGPQELRLLEIAAGFVVAEVDDVLDEILNAPDRDGLLNWLRRRGLIHHDAKLGFTLVHAGIPAEWTFSQALTFGYEVESALSGSNYAAFLENRMQDQTRWHAKLRGWKRLNFIANAYTLMNYCTPQGKLSFQAIETLPADAELVPWYQVADRQVTNTNIVFANQAGFTDQLPDGIYALPCHGSLVAMKLSIPPENILLSAG